MATAGARLRPFATLMEGSGMLFDMREPGYAYLYWDRIDAVGHLHGPHSSEFDAAAVAAHDALEAGLRAGPRMLLLITANHGQVPVDPAGVDYLDELWPALPGAAASAPGELGA